LAGNDGIDRTSVRVCGRYALHGTPRYLARPALLPVMCTPSGCAGVQGGTGGAYSRRPAPPGQSRHLRKNKKRPTPPSQNETYLVVQVSKNSKKYKKTPFGA